MGDRWVSLGAFSCSLFVLPALLKDRPPSLGRISRISSCGLYVDAPSIKTEFWMCSSRAIKMRIMA